MFGEPGAESGAFGPCAAKGLRRVSDTIHADIPSRFARPFRRS